MAKADIKLSFKKNRSGKGGMFFKKYKDPATGKWKEKYFGAGKNKSDRSARRLAVEKCLIFEAERELAESQARMHQHYLSVMDGKLPISSLGPNAQKRIAESLQIPIVPSAAAEVSDDELQEHFESPDTVESLAQRQLLYARSSAKRKANPKKDKPTIAQLVDEWLAFEQGRVGTGSVVQRTVDKQKSGIKPFVEHANGDYFNGNVEDMLMSFRAKIDMRFAGAEISGWTHRGYIKAAWQFIEWCYTNRKLQEKPRCENAFCKQVPVTKEGKPIGLADINKLWAAAADRQKCFIALGLNCGMKNADVAALKGSNLVGDRLIGNRPKTGVPFNVKLWPVTVELTEKCRDNQGDDELLFVNSEGGAIDSGVFSSLFKKVSTRAGVIVGKTSGGNDKGATFEQLRDTAAENVRQIIREGSYDMGMLQVFLQHKDSSTAAYYVSNRPEELQSNKLDEITDKLGEVYGLKL